MALARVVDRVLGRVRRRQRAQAILDGTAHAAVLGAGLVLAGVYLWRLHVIHARGLGFTIAGAMVLIALNGLRLAIRRIPLDRAALAIDVSHQLHDRVRSALSFT